MWRRRNEKPLREQLTEARNNLRRQLEILERPSTMRGGPPDNRALIATLAAELDEIEQALGDLGPEDA